MNRQALFVLLFGSVLTLSAAAQIQPKPLVTRSIDKNRVIALHGSLHPLAEARYDRGAVSNSFSAGRMLLLLNRPPEREAALQQLLQNLHTRGSASYHKWLTPEQFGAQFGPADADIEAAAAWLVSQGLQVVRTSRSRQFIEFSGTAGNLSQAFHTEIHEYNVNGETHYANATELKIPEALAPLIRNVAPMNNFRAEPYVKVVGPAQMTHAKKVAAPQWTAPNQYGTSNPYEFTVTPEDFATQYNLAPLYQAGVNGAGQTIGIINESNIDLSLVDAYQKLFGVAGTPPQVVVDGDDPGDLIGVDVEAYLDVELAGAVAPKATVDLYIASAGYLIDPLALAAVRAVEDNQASVLSVSFGQCEAYLGNAGNEFWSALWEQAAAQGQTILVSSGDSGPVCGGGMPWVSGLASTPWNVAVGGTDFYYNDYATGGASATTLWNATNDANLGSLKATLPEQAWGDPFGLNVIPDSIARGEYAAGGGGPSNCATQDSQANPQYPCTGGYAKPAWQSGPGVPTDGVRDLPDVSLFASNGANLSAYAICAYAGECAAGSGEDAAVLLVGGTSASAPAMAGIMALVNQKYGRQGQANFTLYPLSQQKPAVFHDIATGSISQYCWHSTTPPCALQWNGYYGTEQYPAGLGYDFATGLGSVDANALVNDWTAIAFAPTATTLQLSSTSVVHGTPVNITASVAPSSGSGTPTGSVAILTSSTLPASQSQFTIPLSSGTGTSSVDSLPGGQYQVTARYGGDGTFAASTSSPQTLTVAAEDANINFSVTSQNKIIAAGGTVAYNMPLQLNIQPAGASIAAGKTDGIATGSAVFTIDSTTATVAFNSAGIASWIPPALSVGKHTASAAYAGDASFKPASAQPVTFSVTPGLTFLHAYLFGPYTYQPAPNSGNGPPILYINTGGALTVAIVAQPDYNPGALGTPAPSGTVQICLGTIVNSYDACQSPVSAQTVPLTPLSGNNAQTSIGVATFPNLAAGKYDISAVYGGDSVWGAVRLMDYQEVFVQALSSFAPSTTTLSLTPASISGSQTATVTATVTGSGNLGTSPTGEIDFYNNDVFLTYAFWTTGVTGATSTFTFTANPGWFLNSGANTLTAVYWGDNGNGPSVSNVVNFTSIQTVGNFTLAPQSPQMTVSQGNSGTVGLNLASLSNFNGTVNLACTPSSSQFSCAVTPATLTLNGTATATVTVNAMAQTAGLARRNEPARRPGWPMAAGILAFGLLFVGRRARRTLLRSMTLGLALLAAFSAVSCGGGGAGSSSSSSSSPPPRGSTPAGTYSLLVTGTANGVVHNAKLTVVVH